MNANCRRRGILNVIIVKPLAKNAGGNLTPDVIADGKMILFVTHSIAVLVDLLAFAKIAAEKAIALGSIAAMEPAMNAAIIRTVLHKGRFVSAVSVSPARKVFTIVLQEKYALMVPA